MIQSCLFVRKTCQSRVNRRAGDVNHVQACLGNNKGKESSFGHCGGHVKIVQACLSVRKELQGIFTTVEVLWVSYKPVYVPERPKEVVLNPKVVL